MDYVKNAISTRGKIWIGFGWIVVFWIGMTWSPGFVESKPRLKKSIPYQALILEASRKYDVNPALIAALIETESHFNPKAKNPRSTATGLMQLIKDTAVHLGLKVTAKRDDRLDARKNIMAGTKYLKRQLELTEGDLEMALAGYHAGPVTAALWGGVPPISREYVAKIRRSIEKYEKILGKKKNDT